jgi:adenine-specific DNA methylase
MDKRDTAVREYIAQRADLIGAVRLPNNAFKALAGTEVTAIFIF